MRPVYALAMMLFASTLTAQQPKIIHAQLTTRAAERGLAAELQTLEKSGTTQWVGYSEPTNAPFNSSWGMSRVSYLERRGYNGESTGEKNSPQDHAVVLMRVAGGKLEQVRAESPDQTLDAGDLPFVWLTGVAPQDSVATLKGVATNPNSKHLRSNAVFLISIHDTPAATPALMALATAGNDLELREKAAFWLANGRGHEGFLAIQKFAREDGDAAFREKLTFDLTLTKDPGAVDELIRMAHNDAAPRVRTQAQFWMAQEARKADAGRIAVSLRQSAEADPDAHARRQAVFAISQLPGDQAVAQLTQLASSSTHPEVREQAVFWLGQSKDPRALEYLSNLLRTQAKN